MTVSGQHSRAGLNIIELLIVYAVLGAWAALALLVANYLPHEWRWFRFAMISVAAAPFVFLYTIIYIVGPLYRLRQRRENKDAMGAATEASSKEMKN
jgi:MFS-type transporter involved in bile tolerance (Atg22 family)